MGLKKLEITAYEDGKYEKETGEAYTVMFNPASYSINYELNYKDDEGIGSTGSAMKFERMKPQTLSLDIIIDGTKVSGEKTDMIDVDDDIAKFFTVVYDYNGDKHRPSFLRLAWGSLIFDCVLKSAKVNFTLFKPDGMALRAKISASFIGQIDDEKRAAKDRKSSPDLTHYRTVKEGDTLQLLSESIYDDPNHYMEIARVNNLNNFRTLEPGTQIYFPPIDKSAAST